MSGTSNSLFPISSWRAQKTLILRLFVHLFYSVLFFKSGLVIVDKIIIFVFS